MATDNVLAEANGYRVLGVGADRRPPFQLQRWCEKQQRWVRDVQMIYLFSDAEHDDGNAVCVVARSDEEAVACARRFCEGFEPRAEDAAVKTIGTEPIVVGAEGYYRPGLRFYELDDFTKLSPMQAAELRRKLDEQHPATMEVVKGATGNGQDATPENTTSGG